jgi:O-antigen/teichoic acid export membrane protein
MVLLSGLLTLKLTAYLLGTVGFSEYAIARRAISVLNFPLLLGLGIGIPRYIALAGSDDKDVIHQEAYFLGGLAVAAPVIVSFCTVAVALPGSFARLFFGSQEYIYLTLPIVVATVGIYLHTLIYGYFRGHLKMWSANFLQLLNICLAPPVAVILAGWSAARSIAFTGIWWTVTSLCICLWVVFRINARKLSGVLLRRCMNDLLKYGIPRVPGEFAYFGLFAVPIFVVAHKSGVEGAGFFSFSISLCQLVSAMFGTIGILLLPYISGLSAERDWGKIQNVVSRTLRISLILIALIVMALEAVLGFLVPWFMGQSFSVAVSQSRWLLLAAIPYVTYLVLRNPLDAITQWPHNSVNLALCFIAGVGLVYFGHLFLTPPIAMFLVLLLLGLLSQLSWKRSLKRVISENVDCYQKAADLV